MGKRRRELNLLFICYRRKGSGWVAGRIYDSLVSKFGKETIFKDVDSIPLGIDFRKHIESAVQKCSVFLVVLYDNWTGEEAEGAARRIDDEDDYVRIEIEAALAREIPVIPLLIEDTAMPAAKSLPQSLTDLAHRNGMKISNDPDFHKNMEVLNNRLEPYLQFKKNDLLALRRLGKWFLIFLASLAALILIAVVVTLLSKQPR